MKPALLIPLIALGCYFTVFLFIFAWNIFRGNNPIPPPTKLFLLTIAFMQGKSVANKKKLEIQSKIAKSPKMLRIIETVFSGFIMAGVTLLLIMFFLTEIQKAP